MKKTIASIGVIASLLLPFVSSAQTRVACVGDSTTWGYGLANQSVEGYPARLQAELGSGYVVKNFGVNGSCMVKNDPASYWNTSAFTDAKNYNAQIIIILLGTNDGDPPRWNAHKGEFYNDYVAMINAFRANGQNPRIFVGYPLPCFTSAKAAQDTTIKTQVIPLIQQVAASQGVSSIDFSTTMQNSSWFQSDGIHPNATGAQRMADLAFSALSSSIAGTHLIVSAQNGIAVDNGGRTTNGAPIILWGNNGGVNQKWTFTQNSDTSWNIISQQSGKALEDPGFSTANGTQMDQWTSNSGDNQRWWVDLQSDGTYKIWNKYSSGALDNSSSSVNGHPLIQWGWNGGSQQRWNLQ